MMIGRMLEFIVFHVIELLKVETRKIKIDDKVYDAFTISGTEYLSEIYD